MARTVAAFGELLWDLLPDRRVLGGAPFNFAYRFSELGNEAFMISAVGADALGDEALETAAALGLDTTHIARTDAYPTGTVRVFYDDDRQPDYEIVEHVAYDHIAFDDRLAARAADLDGVCFGTLAQRAADSRDTLHALLDRISPDTVRLYDINLRKNTYSAPVIDAALGRSDVLKLNEDEARMLPDLLDIPGGPALDTAARLLDAYPLRHVVVTLGRMGALCVSSDGDRTYDPGYDIDLVDPLGSGDAFTAGFAHQILHGRPAIDGCRLGNILGACVATLHGGTTPLDDEQIDAFVNNPPARVIDPRFQTIFPPQTAPLQWQD